MHNVWKKFIQNHKGKYSKKIEDRFSSTYSTILAHLNTFIVYSYIYLITSFVKVYEAGTRK